MDAACVMLDWEVDIAQQFWLWCVHVYTGYLQCGVAVVPPEGRVHVLVTASVMHLHLVLCFQPPVLWSSSRSCSNPQHISRQCPLALTY